MKSNLPLKREEILSLLAELGNILYQRNVQANMFIYGGTVMCIEYMIRYQTFDVDCIYDNGKVYEAANELAIKYNLNKDWLNEAVAEIVYNDMKKQDISREVVFGGLNIRIPTAKQLLAMKLFSARMDSSSDFEDAYNLARMLGIKTELELRNVLSEYFKLESIRERNKKHKNVIGRFIKKLSERLK